MNAGLAFLQRFLRETSGIALDDDKGYLVEDRLAPVLRAASVSGLDDLAGRLRSDGRSELARTVVEALTINETSFFRDRALFDTFSTRLLPEMIKARAEHRQLRIWCAGCSTGQEPYSLAMLIDENIRKLTGWHVEIIATDLSRTVVETAERGIYSQFEVQRGLPVAMLLRYFRHEGERFQISDYLRAKVSFRVQNLMAPARDHHAFDLIFCRNVLIYFDVAGKRQVLANLTNALAPDGYLVLGAAETVCGLSDTLHPEASSFLFKRVPEGRRLTA